MSVNRGPYRLTGANIQMINSINPIQDNVKKVYLPHSHNGRIHKRCKIQIGLQCVLFSFYKTKTSQLLFVWPLLGFYRFRAHRDYNFIRLYFMVKVLHLPLVVLGENYNFDSGLRSTQASDCGGTKVIIVLYFLSEL